MSNFTHLHVHTQYSTLDGASQIPAFIDKAIADGMTAMAITDHGNMFGVKEFFNCAAAIGKKTAFSKTNKTKAGKKSLPPAVCLTFATDVAPNRHVVC